MSTIRFPNLGITLHHVPRTFAIGSFTIAMYGIVIAAAFVCGILLAMHVAKKTGQDPDAYFSLALLVMVFSLLGARAYYVIFSWDYYGKHPMEILNFRGGGLAIYGGVIAGVVTTIAFARHRRMNVLTMLDTASTGLVVGQVIGRWGNFFNREAFGGYTDNLLAMQIPRGMVRSDEVTQAMLDHMETIDGVQFIQVHPTFLYESLWNIGVLMILLTVTAKVKKRFKGEVFLDYLFLYGSGRGWIEGLRTDQLLIRGTSLPVSQVLSVILAFVSLTLIIIGNLSIRKERKR